MRRRLLLVTVLVTAIFLLLAGPAFAEISQGSCEATVSSNLTRQPINVRNVSSTNKAQAVPVSWDGSVTAGATTPGLAGAYRVELEIWGFRWKVADGTGSGNSWSRTAEVKPYAIYGTGYYRVHGVTESPPCDGAVLINIIGKNALGTAGGLVALGLSVIGTVGMVVTSIACGFGRGMGIPRSQIITEGAMPSPGEKVTTPGGYETHAEPSERTTPGGYERFVDRWQDVKTPGGYVSWCGTASRHASPPLIREICGNHSFQERMADVCRG